jgi:antirestriction protein ArdC
MDKQELYSQVTKDVIAQIVSGAKAADWRMPWQAIAETAQPVNALTGAPYRGGNHLVFAIVAIGHGYSGHWATYKQWSTLGAQVRKGERATHGVKWSQIHTKSEASEDGAGTRLVPFCFSVFAAEQVDGWTAPDAIIRDTPERNASAEAYFAAIGADVRHGGNQAFYHPVEDFLQLPNLDQFGEAHDYYATSAHEHAHWTGHKDRLDRNMANRFGTEGYAAEELVAEMSAAFTCAALGLSSTPRPDHAQYLAGWLKVLRSDPSALFTAASKAQAATDYLAEMASAREVVAA